jgi:hypothetical protein
MSSLQRSHLTYLVRFSTKTDITLAMVVFNTWCNKYVHDHEKQYGFVQISEDSGKFFLNTAIPMIDLVLSGYMKILTDDLTNNCKVTIYKTISE